MRHVASTATAGPVARARHILVVDGTCVFCSRLVQLIARHDPDGLFHFAHLQSEVAQRAISRHGGDPDDYDAVYLLTDVGTATELLHVDGAAGRIIWPSVFPVMRCLRAIPLVVLNRVYRLFGRYRLRVFGRHDSCALPPPELLDRFIQDESANREVTLEGVS